MTIKQDFLKLAGLPMSTIFNEAEEQALAKFAKNSVEVDKVRTAIRKAIHHCEDMANNTKNVNLRKTYEKDSEDYDNILLLVASNKQKQARSVWQKMDTAGRDVIFDVVSDKEARQLVADYFGTTLHESADDSIKVGDIAQENRVGTKQFTVRKVLGNMVTGSDGQTYHISKIVKIKSDTDKVQESSDENDKIVDQDIQELKTLVAKLEKAQEKDNADEGTTDSADTKVTVSIAKIKADIETLIKAQQADTDEEDDKDEEVSEAVNHIGDKEYQTYPGWKAACKKAYPGCAFRGDIDIGAATLDGKDVGEWDGAIGSVFKQTVKEAQTEPAKFDKGYFEFFVKSHSLRRSMAAADKKDPQEYEVVGVIKAADHKTANKMIYAKYKDIVTSGVTPITKAAYDSYDGNAKLSESADIKVIDFEDSIKSADKEDKQEKDDTTKVPSEVTKSLKDKIKDLETEIKYISHLDNQSETIINLNGSIQVMNDILELMSKGCDESMKNISILLTSLEGVQKTLIPKEVWKYMAVDYANPAAKSSLMDKFREVKLSNIKKD